MGIFGIPKSMALSDLEKQLRRRQRTRAISAVAVDELLNCKHIVSWYIRVNHCTFIVHCHCSSR